MVFVTFDHDAVTVACHDQRFPSPRRRPPSQRRASAPLPTRSYIGGGYGRFGNAICTHMKRGFIERSAPMKRFLYPLLAIVLVPQLPAGAQPQSPNQVPYVAAAVANGTP